jgi:H+/Cl- antiporter ClcA
VLHLPLSLLAALGFAAVFAAASKTPWACSLMAAEIFGWKILPFALLACFCSYYFSGPKSIYKKQKWLDQGRPFFTWKRKSTNE